MRRLLGLAGCILLGSCGNQSTAGGGSDQPNSLDALVLRQDGTPAVGAAARWVAGDWNPYDTSSAILDPVVGEELRVGSDGRLVATKPSKGRWHLEIIDSAARQVAVVDTLSRTLRLEPASQWSGVVVSRGAMPTRVGLAGTSRVTKVGADRRFLLDWLPSGSYRVLAAWNEQVRQLSSRSFDAGERLVDDTLQADSAEVELLDLYRMPLRCALRGHFWPDQDTFAGQWFQTKDTSSRIGPFGWAQNPALALKESGSERYLRWSFRLGAQPTQVGGITMQPWAGVGLNLAPNFFGLDWRGVTAIRVKVRGRGAFRMQLHTWTVDSLNSWGHFGSVITADPEWHWIDIPVKSLWPQQSILDRGISWDGVAHGVYAIAFYAYQVDAQLEIMDIRVSGFIAPRGP